MSRQARNFILVSLAVAMGLTILIQSGCKKDEKKGASYISREDFMDKMDGKWYVKTFQLEYQNTANIHINYTNDTIGYSTSPDWIVKHYLIDDSSLCTLPYIENIQNWIITQSNNDLILETEDVCGDFKNYNIDFDNYRYGVESFMGLEYPTYTVYADVKLVNADITMTLNHFEIEIIQTPDPHMSFYILDGDYTNIFTLHP